MTSTFVTPLQSAPSFEPSSERFPQRVLRWVLFAYVVIVACPIRYWNVEPTVDSTWVFAINQAVARRMGSLVWTTGPLGYLVFPQHIGTNLSQALAFQCALWLALAAIFSEVFFRSGFPIRNVAAFAIFFGLSAPLYWFNYMGAENLLLAAVLLLLTLAHRRGDWKFYAAALVLAGIVPLIKLTAGIIAAGAVAGYLAFQACERRRRAIGDLILAAIVPAAVASAIALLFLPSVSALAEFVRRGIDAAGNYSAAMSEPGDLIEVAGAAETVAWLAVLLFNAHRGARRSAMFQSAILSIPLLLSFKHGFVRQDAHIVNFFCFAGVALALVALTMRLEGKRIGPLLMILLAYSIVWVEYSFEKLKVISELNGSEAAHAQVSGGDRWWARKGELQQVTGAAPLNFAWHVFVRRDATAIADRDTAAFFSPETRIEPEIRAFVGHDPVATTKLIYDSAALDGVNLQFMPVVQRYGAYTPSLDGLNAAWIRDHGPRYLIADWESIDHRQPWAETPALWFEIYRWYETRLLTKRNLLLERRAAPRFSDLVQINGFAARFSDGFALPDSDGPLFWSMDCRLTMGGAFEKFVFRIPEIFMTIDGGERERVIPEVLVSPVLGNFLPQSLGQLAALLTPSGPMPVRARKFSFSGPGIDAYAPVCQVRLWTPAN